jgi:hypothetical protein
LFGGWLVACFGIACFEALYAFRYNALARGFVAMPWRITWTPSGIWHALTTYEHPTYLFAQMSAMDIEVVTRSEPVALGELTIESMPLLGQLSMPVGLRDIVFLSRATASDEKQLRGLLAQHRVRYVFWRDDEPTPSPIVSLSRRRDRTTGLWRVYEVEPPNDLTAPDVRAK